MKWRIYIFIGITTFFWSCKNIEKMVDKGQYDEAILYAAEKMQGEEYKETTYVVALEEAFYKVMQRDLNRIEHWTSSGRPEYYGRIYRMYETIASRQERIRPFLPLISKDGYTATFRMMDPRPYLEEYAEKDSEYHYQKGKELLTDYDSSDKAKAREAYSAFRKVMDYYSDYRDIKSLTREARNMGTEHILVSTDYSENVYLDRSHLRILADLDVPDNDKWTVFHNRYDTDIDYDYEVVLRIENIAFDREREVVNNFQREKEVQVGYRYVLDADGNVAKDSLGNDIKEPNFVWVSAQLTEVKRSKQAEVAALLQIKDFRSGKVLEVQEIVTPVIYEGYGFSYRGDKRALDAKMLRRMDNYLEPFPEDGAMIQDALIDIKKKAYKKMKRTLT